MHPFKTFVYCTLVLLSLCCTGYSQEETDYKRSYYAFLGVGWGGQKTAVDLGLLGQISDQDLIGITIDGTQKGQTENLGYIFELSRVKQKTTAAINLLYGKIYKARWGHFSLMTGVSFVNIVEYKTESALFPGYYEGIEKDVTGVAFQGSAMFAKKFAGIGARAFLNVNNTFTYGGFTISFALGRIHYKR